jgi:hypothetical protein
MSGRIFLVPEYCSGPDPGFAHAANLVVVHLNLALLVGS